MCNQTVGCNRTVTSANNIQCTQLNPPIRLFHNNHLPDQTGDFPKWTNLYHWAVLLPVLFSLIFDSWYWMLFHKKRKQFVLSEMVMVLMIYCNGDLWLIVNRTSCHPSRSVIILVIKQVGLPLPTCLIPFITRMITDRFGLIPGRKWSQIDRKWSSTANQVRWLRALRQSHQFALPLFKPLLKG